ncbi:MAG: hypothetical protein OSJ22_06630 [Rikenellaceae bacterium]|nr:hypothetical protein [Rikenellaceae bacterium]
MENREYTVTVLTENKIGVLNRITAIYLRHKINMEGVRVMATQVPGVSMITISSYGEEAVMERIVKQLRRIVEVFDSRYKAVESITPENIYGEILSGLEEGSDIR